MDTDTAEEVVNEMIHEHVLPSQYQHLITGEINRILREMNRPAASEDKNREEHMQRTGTLPRTSDAQRNGTLPRSDSERQRIGTLSRNSETEWQDKQRGSFSRVSSDADRLREDGQSQKGSHGDILSEFDDFPCRGLLFFNLEYDDGQIIEDLVKDTAMASNRGMEKANEWLAKLKEQDIMTVGDLRDLQDDDWSSL